MALGQEVMSGRIDPVEWGVHVAFFGERVALAPEPARATVHGDASNAVWSAEERRAARRAVPAALAGRLRGPRRRDSG
jgi:hypothetical protein